MLMSPYCARETIGGTSAVPRTVVGDGATVGEGAGFADELTDAVGVGLELAGAVHAPTMRAADKSRTAIFMAQMFAHEASGLLASQRAGERIVHDVPLVSHTGDVVLARAEFDRRPGANLRYCLRKRFAWMQRYLGTESFAVEVGCGAGFSEKFLRAGRLELTDAEPRPWVSRVVDAQELPYIDASVDVLIANNVIHHLAYPDRFFREAARVLRPSGHLLVQECNLGKTTEWALRVTGHEGFDWSADPFDASRPCNDPKDPWSANCAIPNLLFDDLATFRKRYPMFEVVDSGLSEFFIHFNNGGISARVPYLPLPEAALKVVDAVDSALVAIAPGFFAAQRRVAFRRL
jgi:SAM-dependent methyltransferase